MTNVAVLTGGSRGIGAATAPLLAEAGWTVCLSYLVDAAAAADVVAACDAMGGSAKAVQADVSVEADVERLFATADELGTVTALVNNAGIAAPKARVDELTVERINDMLRVNVLGPFLCARAAVLRMSTLHGGAGGAIVNISSAAARVGSPGMYVDYAASKGAIDTMTVGLAKEVAAEGIRVNGIRPGLIETEIHARGGLPNRVADLAPTVPMQRGGAPIEVARAIVWLCSTQASYVTGAILDVSGGR